MSTAVVAGCAVVNPYVRGDSTEYRKTPTLEAAISYAEDTRDEYYGAIRDYALLNRGIGVALIGAAAAGAFLGITGGDTDTIAGLGVGGAGLFGANSLLNSRPRLRVYAEGAKAVSCSLSVFAPARAADPADLQQLRNSLATLSVRLSSLKVALAALKAYQNEVPNDAPRKRYAESVKTAAEATLQRGRQTRRDLDKAGARLYAFVNKINDDVTTALIALEPDIAQLVASLRSTLTANAGLIVGPLPQKPAVEQEGQKAKLHVSAAAESALSQAAQAAAEAQTTANEVEALIASVAVMVNDLNLAACENLVRTRPFRVRPQPNLVINTAEAEPAGNVIVSGGTAPYNYNWVGQPPGAGVSLAEVPPEQRSAGQFIIQVKATQNTPAQIRQLLVEDSADSSTSILVNFSQGAAPAPARNGQTNGRGDTPPPGVPIVRAIQSNFVAVGCLAPLTANGKSNVDGLWGVTTNKAYEQFAEDQLGGLEQAAATLGQPKTAEFNKQLLDQTVTAATNNFRCAALPG